MEKKDVNLDPLNSYRQSLEQTVVVCWFRITLKTNKPSAKYSVLTTGMQIAFQSQYSVKRCTSPAGWIIRSFGI
jgi:hypothetical protein